MPTPRWTFRTMLDRSIRRRAKPFDVADWAASAVVFAPHPDDETLGCGGIAARKLASGTPVRFVFVTDGTTSHAHLVAPDALRTMREAEAVEAVRRLGVTSSEDVRFLRFPDGSAADHVDAIAKASASLLEEWRPQSVYVTHAKDPPSDHRAVNAAVRAALRAYARPVSLFEYPVWYWYHWPRMRFGGDLPGMWRTTLGQTLRTGAGLGALSTLNSSAFVGDFLDVKRDALAAHVSQVGPVEDSSDWRTLSDLSHGDFVAQFMGDHEFFTRHEITP
jgi:LmbE family N-acetylglucosaminyl deacetylase